MVKNGHLTTKCKGDRVISLKQRISVHHIGRTLTRMLSTFTKKIMWQISE